MKRLFWVRASSVLLLAVTGCDGCRESARPAASYAPKQTEMVIELSEVGVFARQRSLVEQLLAGLITSKQQEGFQKELEVRLGFDPTTAQGLAKSGLSPKKPALLAVSDDGRQGLWVLPAEDPAKLEATLDHLAETTLRVDIKKPLVIDKAKGKLLITKFGEQEILIGGYLIDGKNALIASGKEPEKLLREALARKPAESLLENAEYQALVKVTGQDSIIRVLGLAGSKIATGVLKQARYRGDPKRIGDQIQSVGAGLAFDEKGLRIEGRARFTAAGLARLQKVWKTKQAAPKGVLATLRDDAVIFAYAAGDPVALLDSLKAADPTASSRLDRDLGKFGEALGFDLQKEIIPMLSGHIAFSLGVTDLSHIARPQDILRDPARAIWAVVAAGTAQTGDAASNGDAQFDKLLANTEPKLLAQGIKRTTRKVDDREVSTYGASPERPLFEVFTSANAWSFTNQSQQSEPMILRAKKPAPDPLAGVSGVYARLQFKPLKSALEQLDIDRISGGGAGALVMRSMIAKAQTILSNLEALDIAAKGADDGVAITARLEFGNMKK